MEGERERKTGDKEGGTETISGGRKGEEMTGQRQEDGEGRHSSGCLCVCVCQQEFFYFYSYEDKMFS